MKVLVIAEGAESRKKVRDAVLDAMQNTGECFTTSHEEGREICLRQKPDVVVVCDYDEVSPMVCGTSFQSYCGVTEIMSAEDVIRMGEKSFPHKNYCKSMVSLQALVYMRYRERGGVPMPARR